jgi:hypothetical protein
MGKMAGKGSARAYLVIAYPWLIDFGHGQAKEDTEFKTYQ